jgi:hypothetical protein
MSYIYMYIFMCVGDIMYICVPWYTYIYTMEYYSAVKKSGVLSFAGKWMELKIIVLNEISQAHKAQCRMFSLICGTHADDDDGTRMYREDCLGLISRRWRKEKDTPCIYMKTVQCHPTLEQGTLCARVELSQ